MVYKERVPGYLYESLDGWTFQQLCQALLSAAFPGVQSYPINQADGGRDAAVSGGMKVFQCKWTAEPTTVTDPVKWLLDEVKKELPKIVKLHARGMRQYELMTNVSGSAVLDRGERDRLALELSHVFSELDGLAYETWWRETIDAHLTDSVATKWKFPQLLSGPEAMQLILHTLGDESRERRERSLRSYIASQYDDDAALRFKQAYKNPPTLTDLFVDVPSEPSSGSYARNSPAWIEMRNSLDLSDDGQDPLRSSAGAVFPTARMITSRFCVDRIQVNGAPGQGKSTLLQYVCQFHRTQLLGHSLEHFDSLTVSAQQRVPFKVALSEYMRARRNELQQRADKEFSLERYISKQVSDAAGGTSFDVDDLNSIITAMPVLIALDALDEVADDEERAIAVTEIQALGRRLARLSAEAVMITTSRPVQDPTEPILPHDKYLHLTLSSLPARLADEFVHKWAVVQNLPQREYETVTETWAIRRQDTHVQNLATNPMQLGILLQIINARGPSLPDRRTLLYDDYIRTLLDREADKDGRVALYRDILASVHGFVAVTLHSNAESAYGDGTISREDLMELLRQYLSRHGRDLDGVEQLFQGVQRVVALVSRKQGTFEFEVQPLREYFCGRYLYDSSPYALPGMQQKGQKHDRLFALLGRPYWQNVLRFFVGCFSEGELFGVVEMLMNYEIFGQLSDFLWARRLAHLLLADQVFADSPHLETRILEFAYDRAGRHATSSIPALGRPRTNKTIAPDEFVRRTLSYALTSAPVAVGDIAELERVVTGRDLASAWVELGREIARTGESPGPWLELGATFAQMRLDRRQANELVAEFHNSEQVIASFAWRGYFFDKATNDPEFVAGCALKEPLHSHRGLVGSSVGFFLRATSVARLVGRHGKPLNRDEHVSRPMARVPIQLNETYRSLVKYANDPGSIESTLWAAAILDERFGESWHTSKLRIAASATFGIVAPPPQLAYYTASTDEWSRRLVEIGALPMESDRHRESAKWLLAVLALAGPTMSQALAPSCEDLIKNLEPTWLSSVVEALNMLKMNVRGNRLQLDEVRQDLFQIYPLFGMCLSTRFPNEGYEATKLSISKGLAKCQLPAVNALRKAALVAELAALSRTLRSKNVDELEVALERIRGYGADLQVGDNDDSGRAQLPAVLAERVARQPDNWPSAILRLAENSLLQRNRTSLLTIASDDGWFARGPSR